MSTDPATTTEAAPPADPGPAEDTDAARSTNAEAAKYRTRLRETEAARDALQARVGRFERAAVERVAAETLSNPSDVWLLEFTADTMLPRSDDGEVDVEAVRAAVQGIVQGRPGLAIPPKRIPDTGGGVRGGPEAATVSWSDLLRSPGGAGQ